MGEAGLEPATSRLRRALSRVALLAPRYFLQPAKAPGQGLEPRFPRSERGVLPLRRSRSALSVHPCLRTGVDARRRPNHVFQAARLRFDPQSGGALEPGARPRSGYAQAKAAVNATASFRRAETRE